MAKPAPDPRPCPPGRPGPGVSHTWRALRHRNFQLYFLGQGISLVGNWMTRIATVWLVYHLTHSALLLGVVAFAGQIVSFCLGPFAGVWVERLDRRKLLLWTQATAALQSLALAILTLAQVVNLWEIIFLSVLQGMINAFDMPGRQSFLIHMIDDQADLGNAIALNSTMVNGAALLGPALAGLLIAAIGVGWCFLADGLSYLAVIASLLVMRLAPQPRRAGYAGMVAQVREGWDYVRSFLPIRSILLLLALVVLVGYPYAMLMPVFVSQVLHGGPDTLGWLMAASGLGALISAMTLAARKSVTGLADMMPVASALLGCALISFGLSHTLWLSLALMALAGFGLMQVAAVSNTIIQSLVPEDKRARVMSYFTMAFFGSAPFGSLLDGALAHWLGAPRTLMLNGACCLAGALWFALQLAQIKALSRPVYQAKGLLPALEGEPALAASQPALKP